METLVWVVLAVVVAGAAAFFFMKNKSASTEVVAPVAPVVAPVAPVARPYGTGLTHITKGNDGVGLSPSGEMEFANGPSSFIDN